MAGTRGLCSRLVCVWGTRGGAEENTLASCYVAPVCLCTGLQAACFVVALRQMARQSIGVPAYSKIQQMKVGRSIGWLEIPFQWLPLGMCRQCLPLPLLLGLDVPPAPRCATCLPPGCLQEQGLAPTLRCYMFAIEGCLRAPVPEHGFVKK